MSTRVESKQILLPDVRLSYPSLFKARKAMKSDTGDDKKPQFQADFILSKKKHAAVITAIQAEEKRILTETFGKLPGKYKSCLREGADMTDNEGNIREGYDENKMRLASKHTAKQATLGKKKEVIDDENVFYGGCYVNAVVTLFPWSNEKSGKGCSASLGPVQFCRDGERLGGGQVIDPDDHFKELEDDDDTPAPAKKKKVSDLLG